MESKSENNRSLNKVEKPGKLIVRAKDGDWIMGEDLIVPVTGEETILEIQEVM